MEIKSFKVKDKVVIDGITYRIIGMLGGLTSLIVLSSTKIKIISIDSIELFNKIQTGEIELIECEKDTKHFDVESMSKEVQELYKLRKLIVQEIDKKFAPLYLDLKSRKESSSLSEFMKDNNIKPTFFWKTIRVYLQSGFNKNSLIDGRINHKDNLKKRTYAKRPGRKSVRANGSTHILNDQDFKNFEEARKLYFDRKTGSVKDVYQVMINNHYRGEIKIDGNVIWGILPLSEIPSLDQLRYYIDTHSNKAEKAIAKTSKQEYRNEQRLLFSDNLKDVHGPCSLWEIDECEIDLFLVDSETRSKVIGRPIVYIMIDVFTRTIVGYSVDLENNSLKGVTNCFLSLIVDKVELCKKAGITVENIFFPDHIYPQRIISDYGSEYLSKEMERICNELNIQHELATPGTGSLKGQVEQTFHQIHRSQNMLLEHNGLITKRHDSDHKNSAVMTIEEFENMLLGEIVVFNKSFKENHPLRNTLYKAGFPRTPSGIWEYGIKKYGSPKPITNDTLFTYSILEKINVSISRKGIIFEGLYYLDKNNDWLISKMIQVINKTTVIEARINPRDISQIYLKDEKNNIHTIPLNSERTGNLEYAHLSLVEYRDIREKQRLEALDGNDLNMVMGVALKDRNMKIISDAIDKTVLKPDTKNIIENRRKEKERLGKEREFIPNENKPLIEQKALPDTSEVIDISLEEALEDISEEY